MGHNFKIFALLLLVLMLGASQGQVIEIFSKPPVAGGSGNSVIYLPIGLKSHYAFLYTSSDLTGHTVSAECNPGGGTNCPCSQQDVGIQPFGTYGEVISNSQGAHTWVNAIGTKKFTDIFPNGDPITLGTFKYSGQFSLPILPLADGHQTQNPEAVHLMIQLWDGSNKLWQSNKTTLEGTIFWALNPWTTDGTEGRIKLYTLPGITLIPTNVKLAPDKDIWHSFELVVDFVGQQYVAITIDGMQVNPVNYKLGQVYHPDWGNDLSLIITTESLAAWPQQSCPNVFTWTTRFRDLRFERIQ